MLLRTSDYQPVEMSLFTLMPTAFDHWRTESRARHVDERHSGLATSVARGLAVWSFSTTATQAWLTWEWVALDGGVITLTNPNDISSNAILIDAADRVVPFCDSSAIFLSLIHDLPWRDEVERVLRSQVAALAEHAPARAQSRRFDLLCDAQAAR